MLIAMRRRKRAMNYLCEPAIMPITSGRVFRHNLLSQRRLIQTKISPTANHKHAQIPEDNSKFILFALPTWVLQMYFQESFLHSPYSLIHPPNTQHKHTAADVCQTLSLSSVQSPSKVNKPSFSPGTSVKDSPSSQGNAGEEGRGDAHLTLCCHIDLLVYINHARKSKAWMKTQESVTCRGCRPRRKKLSTTVFLQVNQITWLKWWKITRTLST